MYPQDCSTMLTEVFSTVQIKGNMLKQIFYNIFDK